MAPVYRSRARFYGYEMMKKRKDNAQAKAQNQTKVAPDGKATTLSNEVNPKNTQRKDATRNMSGNVPTFTKQRVPSTEEIAHSGRFKSGLRAEFTTADKPSTANESAIEDELFDSPPASLVRQAPVYKEVNGQLEQQFPAVSATESVNEEDSPNASKSSSWSCSFLKTLVKLFAGRRKSMSKSDKSKQSAKSSSVPDPIFTATDYVDVETPSQAQSEYGPTPPLTPPSPPRLTHRQVIPPVTRNEAEDLSRLPIYKPIASAPEHRTMGTGVVGKDTFTPTHVQRGFHVPSAPQASVALEKRRNNSASNLLDREADVWARWHAKYDTRESHPFSRPAGVAV